MLEEKLIELIERLESAGSELAPGAFDAVVRGAQLEGMMTLIVGGVSLVAVAPFTKTAMRLTEVALNDDTKEPVSIAYGISAFIFGLSGFALGIVGVVSLLWVDNWIAALDPIAYIAKSVVLP